MELQNISKVKRKRNYDNLYQTLGDDKKVDYQLLEKSLADVKYDVEIFENFLSPKSKLVKKLHRRKLKNNTLIKSKRIARNSILFNLSSNNLNMRNNSSSSNSLDKLIKKQFSLKKKENRKINDIKNIKRTLNIKSRNNNLNLEEDKKSIFITDYKMSTTDNKNNPINNIIQSKQRDFKQFKEKYYSFSLNKNLPPIKSQVPNFFNNNDAKASDYINKTISSKSKYSNAFIKTEPMIIKKNKFLYIDEKSILNMIKKNKSIISRMNTVKNKFDNDMVNFEALYKYLNWKYGISDSNKYFIDIGAYKKDSEELINKKKSFYDRLDDMVDQINKNKKKKDMENLKKQYGININKKKDNVDYNSINVNETEKLFLKGKKIKNVLKEVYNRKILEKKVRRKIKTLLDSSQDKIKNINKNFYTFRIKELELNDIDNK